ncbi:hypothetical protein AK812_SmicGene10234 [Symbiodinium microadriaticum]|uniref:Uncharacterized protein n=1 Tax=Symbiodinium microadriaticum TaxID=2951 RepID=A0A1Q9EGA1_SYMMI|nr:hypothetical protein AK812_SmicGene10234 [Symbiodinium microadriaticum]
MGRGSAEGAPVDKPLRLKRRTDGITALGRALRWQRALQLVLEESAPDIFVFNAGVASLGRASHGAQAVKEAGMGEIEPANYELDSTQKRFKRHCATTLP